MENFHNIHVVSDFFFKVALDTIRPLLKTYNGNKYILVGNCKIGWLTFCITLDFLQSVFYPNVTNIW
jgi:hypothetical protein